jgi:hypothetical protein
VATPTVFWYATPTASRSRSRATLRIPPAWAATAPSARPRSWGSTTLTAAAVWLRGGEPQAWSSLPTALAAQREAIAQSHGEGLRVITGATTSPTLARQVAALKQLYPAMQRHRWEPVSSDAVRAGAMLAYGQRVELVPKLDAVDLLLTIDSDLFDDAPGHLRFARDFAARRNPAQTDRMNRAYAIEPTSTLTGVAADHRFIAGPHDLARIVPALAASVQGREPTATCPAGSPLWSPT